MSNRRKPKNLADIAAKTTPMEKSVSLCVAGAKFAEHQRLEDELVDAMNADAEHPGKINEEPKAKALAKKIRALEESMEADTFDFTFRQIDAQEWRELAADHPPLNPMRERWNQITFAPVAVAKTCVDPDTSDPAAFEAFWKKLSAGQREILFTAAVEVNQVGVSIPFSAAASAILRNSVPSSTTAAGTESLTASS